MLALSLVELALDASLPDPEFGHVFSRNKARSDLDFLAQADRLAASSARPGLDLARHAHLPSARTEAGTILLPGSVGSFTIPASDGDRSASILES